MSTNPFENSLTTFKDTLNCKRITVRGFNVEVDDDGFVVLPADAAAEVAPHGFVPMRRPAKQAFQQPQGNRR